MIKDPLIRKIFDDLDAFRNYCRIEGKPFHEAMLYKKGDRIWEGYQYWIKNPRNKVKLKSL